jgi:hypothetical protein
MTMVNVRVRVDNEGESFTVQICAESLQKVERIAKARYPGSTVKLAFPIEPESFFGSPRPGGGVGLEAPEALVDAMRPS